MSINNEECLRLCSKGELGVLKEMLRDLDRTEIESIRDKFNARYKYIEGKQVVLYSYIFPSHIAVSITRPDLVLSTYLSI